MRLLILACVIVFAYCSNEEHDEGELRSADEGDSFFLLSTSEIITTILVFINSSLASAVGIGGGTFYVVTYIILLNYNSSDAVALSQFTIIGGSFTTFLIKLFFRHPTRNKPLIEYDINTVVLSPLLIGSTLGVIVNISLPYWTITLTFTVILTFLSISTVKSGIKKYQSENTIDSQSEPLIKHEEIAGIPELEEIYENEKKFLPIQAIMIILLIYSSSIFLFILRGSNKFDSIVGIKFCSYLFWLLSVLIIIVLSLTSLFCVRYVTNKYEKKVKLGYNFDEFDVKWTQKVGNVMSIAGFGAGFIGAIIGIGGSLVLSPLMLKMKIRPDVMTATNSTNVFLVSTMIGFQYLLAGKIKIYMALWLSLFTFFGSFLGTYGIKTIVSKYKRTSIIIFLLAATMIVGSIMTPIYTIITSIQDPNTDYGFHDYCGS